MVYKLQCQVIMGPQWMPQHYGVSYWNFQSNYPNNYFDNYYKLQNQNPLSIKSKEGDSKAKATCTLLKFVKFESSWEETPVKSKMRSFCSCSNPKINLFCSWLLEQSSLCSKYTWWWFSQTGLLPVSYTHLTLPTKLEV